METLKLKKAIVLVVNLCIASLLSSCSQNRIVTNERGNTYDVMRFTSKTGRTCITGSIAEFDARTNRVPGFIRINGIVSITSSGEFDFLVMPGSYSIECGFVGKKVQKLKQLKLVEGDSVTVRFYLADDDSPLYDKRRN